jgi:hypothetical protein
VFIDSRNIKDNYCDQAFQFTALFASERTWDRVGITEIPEREMKVAVPRVDSGSVD